MEEETVEIPKRKFEQISRREKRINVTEESLDTKVEKQTTLLYILLVVNIATLGFLTGMFISYLFF